MASQSPEKTEQSCRVLHLLQGLAVGGLEKTVLELVSQSRANGHDDRLLLYDTPGNRADADLNAGNVPWDFLGRRPGFDLRFARRLSRYLIEHPAQVLHAHNDTALFYGALALSLNLSCRTRLVATFHNAPAHPTWRARVLTRWAAARADQVIAVSGELQQRLLATGWVRNCRVIINGVDTDSYSPHGQRDDWRAHFGLPENTILIGHIGRFDANKRQQDLIEAVRIARSSIPQIALICVGQGARLAELQQQLKGEDRIWLIPRVSDVAAFLRELDLFVLCSQHEGTPLALLEAMSCGRAVIATAVGGIPEILGNEMNQCGAQVMPANPSELAAAIVKLGCSQDQRKALGEAARRRIIEAFSAAKMVSRYEEIYRSVIHQ